MLSSFTVAMELPVHLEKLNKWGYMCTTLSTSYSEERKASAYKLHSFGRN